MQWIKCRVSTTSEGIDVVCELLYSLGITGVEIEDYNEFLEHLENTKDSWDYVDDSLIAEKDKDSAVIFYVTNNQNGLSRLDEIRSALLALKSLNNTCKALDMSFCDMCEEDWANNWKKYFKPICVGEKILIKPEWEEISEDLGRIVFTVNPGMNFGTGLHATTQLCIAELEKHVKKGQRVLDLGCGSGILSIISLLLGAKSALAVDIDPNAVQNAYENAAKNGIDRDVYEVISGDIINDDGLASKISEGTYNIVVANIVADVIIAMCGMVKTFLDKDGLFIMSGIIADRLSDVTEALCKEGFDIISVNKKEDWVLIVAKL